MLMNCKNNIILSLCLFHWLNFFLSILSFSSLEKRRDQICDSLAREKSFAFGLMTLKRFFAIGLINTVIKKKTNECLSLSLSLCVVRSSVCPCGECRKAILCRGKSSLFDRSSWRIFLTILKCRKWSSWRSVSQRRETRERSDLSLFFSTNV